MMEEHIAGRSASNEAKLSKRGDERKYREQKYLVQVRSICHHYVLTLDPR